MNRGGFREHPEIGTVSQRVASFLLNVLRTRDMDMRKLIVGLPLIALAAACADNGPPPPPPVLKVVSPVRGTIQSGLADVEVRGNVIASAETELAVASVEVNGVPAQVAVDGSFTARVPVGAGATMLHTIAKDVDGNEAKDTRTIQAGNLLPVDSMIQDGITAALSDDALAAIGTMAGNLLTTADLGSMVTPMNPVVDSGDGPDCLFAQANVQDVNLADANITLVPYQGGLMFSAEVIDLDVPFDARWAVACLDGSTHGNIRASRVYISGNLDMSVVNDKMEVHLVNPNVQLSGFDIDASGLTGTVIDMLNLDSAMGWILPMAVEKFMGPMMNDAIGGLAMAGPLQLTVGGAQLEMEVHPAAIEFTPAGGKLRLDTRFHVIGSEAVPGFIYTENGQPTMEPDNGFQIAMADDAANQLMTGFWAVGAMNMTIPHKAGQFDTLITEARLPPMISATGADGTMKLIVGDMMVTLVAEGVEEAKLAYNVEVAMAIDSTGQYMKIALQPPTIYITTTDEIPNTTNFSDEDLANVHEFIIEQMMGQITPLLGAIPLPSFGGVQLSDLDINGRNGYVTINGVLQQN